MKIKGKPITFFKSKVITVEDSDGQSCCFTLCALPLDFYDELEKELPRPVPPKAIARDKNGKVERDETGKPIILVYEDDQNYLKQKKEVDTLQSVALVVRSLSQDTNVEFDSKRENFSTPKEYYQAVHEELKKSVSLHVFLKLVKETSSMLEIKPEETEDAKKNFLSTMNTQ